MVYTRLAEVLNPGTWVAQAVAFPRPRFQMNRFREVMFAAGFAEIRSQAPSGRAITRKVPNRRWYAHLSGNQNSAREYLLYIGGVETPSYRAVKGECIH